MKTSRLVVAGALSALILVPVGATARAPKASSESVAPAAAFSATVTAKTYTGKRSVNVTVKATNVPSGKTVTGYFLSENPTANPVGNTTGWKTLPTAFTLSDLDGPHTIYVWARTNNAVSARGSDTTLLDRVAPTVSAFDVTATTSTTRSTAVTFTSADAGGAAASGVLKYAVVNGTNAPNSTSTAWKDAAPTSIKLSAGNGVKTVSAFVRDRAGNVSTVASDTVTLAIPGPSVDIQLPAYTKAQNVAVTLVATDGTGAGIAGYILKETNSAPAAGASGWKIKPSAFTLSAGQGSKTVYAWVKDNNANVSAVDSATTLWDATAPTASLTITTSSPTTSATINVTASGNALGGSPIASYALVTGTGVPGAASAWKATAPTTFQLPAGNGLKTISLFVKDSAGNVSAANTKTITMTTAAPTLTLDVTKSCVKTTKVNVAVDTTHASGTSITGYFLSSSATPVPTASTPGWKTVTTNFEVSSGDGMKTVYGWVKDSNNTVSAVASDNVRLDTTAPTATITVGGSPGPTPTVTIAGADSGCGVTGYAIVVGTTAPDASDSLAWSANAVDATVNLGSGLQTVTGFTKDGAGNVSVSNSGNSKPVTKT